MLISFLVFIAEGGPECIVSKTDAVQRCINATLTSAKANVANISTEELSEFTLDSAEKCG